RTFNSNDDETAKLSAGSGGIVLEGNVQTTDGYIASTVGSYGVTSMLSEGAVWLYQNLTPSWGYIGAGDTAATATNLTVIPPTKKPKGSAATTYVALHGGDGSGDPGFIEGIADGNIHLIAKDSDSFLQLTDHISLQSNLEYVMIAADNGAVYVQADTDILMNARTGNVQLQATDGASSIFSQHYNFTIDVTRVYSDAIHESTTSAAANMRIDGSATILRSTSSRRYKLDIEDARPLESVLDI